MSKATLACLVPLAALAACTAPATKAEPLDRSKLELAFDEGFDAPPSFWDAQKNPGGRWKTNYYFSVQELDREKGWESRTLVPNKERQFYGDPHRGMDPFEWKDGVLTIVARPNPFKADARTNGLPYLSGLITTEKSFNQATGYFEARIALPSGKGIWPAFWLLPMPEMKDGWGVPSGDQEVDVFESIGEPGKLYFTFFEHNGGKKVPQQMGVETGLDLSKFHTYGMLVTKDELVWYLDGKEMRRAPNRDFHRPAYMLLNLAVGGAWPGDPDATTRFPAKMHIDWVRAYKLK